MAVVDFSDWLTDFTRPDTVWYVKRLAANDTLATDSHQAGPYIPNLVLFGLFPRLRESGSSVREQMFDLYIDSDADHRQARAVWYASKNEGRFTRLGGRSSALLDPDSTGALTVFAFVRTETGEAQECHVWVCRTEAEEELIEDRVGPVEPGKWQTWEPVLAGGITLFASSPPLRTSCRLNPSEMPPAWLTSFPTGAEIVEKAVELRPDTAIDPDERLIRRRNCEFEIFQSVEEAFELPIITAGFSTIQEFVSRAQTILQRRKARSGRSLELQARAIFLEEALREGRDFDHDKESEAGRRPDFLFPSQDHYRDPAFPAGRLRMLAAKTTCKDRWRQILNEAGRIETKHLLTLQEGVSVGQFQEMKDSGVQLVVPAGLRSSYPAAIRAELVSFESFIGDVRLLT